MVNKDLISEKDGGEKKRRKTSTTDSAAQKLQREDIYTGTINFEEQESLKRSAEKDSVLFHQTCEDLKKIFTDISVLKKDNSDKSKQEICDKRIEGSMLMIQLKKLNRLDKVRIRAGRDALHKEKQRVDSNRLQLQNLLYEADHLKKEVQRCYQFKSQDEDIELVPVDEFYENAPESISRPDQTKEDEHTRRLARLEWELQQRKELAALCKDLQTAKEKVAQDINSKMERLESLAPRLQALLNATRPLQEALDMEIEKEWEIQKSARLLPIPLYLLYANLIAYAEACDPLLSATINGDDEEAKQMEDSVKEIIDESEENNQDSDNDDGDNETERVLKSHHHRRQSKSVLLEQKRSNLFKPHPLNITFFIKSKDKSGGILSITVNYLPELGFVTVKCQLNNLENIGVAAGDVINSETILDCLHPTDYGNESPNSKTKFQLEDLSMDPMKLMNILYEKHLGKPYKWAQKLCGLDFITNSAMPLSMNTVPTSSNDLCQNSVPNVIKQIRARWQARFNLCKQICALENGNIELPSSSAEVSNVRISATLTQWTTITWQDYIATAATQKFIEENLVSQYDLFYQAIITRGSAKLQCFICIRCDFPAETPLWALSLNWNGNHSAVTNSSIREMEYWINALEEPKHHAAILTFQLKRAMYCLDIYLETEGPLYSPAEFMPEKTFLKAFRGRQRSRPFKVVQNGSGVVYTQI